MDGREDPLSAFIFAYLFPVSQSPCHMYISMVEGEGEQIGSRDITVPFHSVHFLDASTTSL